MAESRGVGRHNKIILSRGVGVYNIIVLYFYNSGKPFYPHKMRGVAKSPGQKFKYFTLLFFDAEICGAKDPFGDFKFHPTITLSTWPNFFALPNYSGPEPIRISTSMNDDAYNETIQRNGKTYHYDPDMDCYYCRYTDESTVSRYAWIALVVALAMLCYWIESNA